jgi:hypothetical protein
MHIDGLVTELQSLLRKDHGCEIHATPFWQDACRAMIESALQRSPRDFLRWETVNFTMHPESCSLFEPWYRYLCSLDDWHERWQSCLTEDPVGNPIPFHLYPETSPLLLQHGYHIACFESATGCDPVDYDVVIEIGGGYGSMARLFYRLGFSGRYLIYDMAPVSVLQRLYLQDIGLSVSKTAGNWTQVFCCTDLFELGKAMELFTRSRCLIMATFSLSEMPHRLREAIASQMNGGDGFLLAYQGVFNGVDNHPYFDYLVKNTEANIEWHKEEIKGLPDNYYLFGHCP